MQLRSLLLALLLVPTISWGQSDSTDYRFFSEKDSLNEIEVNFLYSYYSQDGNHSPVTGGEGTELLTDQTPTVIINVPLGNRRNLYMNLGADFYTSASTGNIDWDMSGASAADTRIHANVAYSWQRTDSSSTWSILGGASSEYDYSSISGGLSWTRASRDKNRELTLKGQGFFDRWSLIYPIEMRDQGDLLPTNNRNSYNFSMVYSQVINKRLQGLISAEVVHQRGLLSTPFHRVYLEGRTDAVLEKLPDQRWKYPIGLRLNYYVSDFFVMRSYYRYYFDNWGIRGQTIELEPAVKVSPFLSLYPFFRYHTQQGSDYFAPLGVHTAEALFYTSDYDLSTLTSTKFGLGFRYAPLYGLSRMKVGFGRKPRVALWKNLDLRFAKYDRSDGLSAWIGSINIGFTIK